MAESELTEWQTSLVCVIGQYTGLTPELNYGKQLLEGSYSQQALTGALHFKEILFPPQVFDTILLIYYMFFILWVTRSLFYAPLQ